MLAAVVVLASGACELVLGDLPPVQASKDASTTPEDGACCDCDDDHFNAEGVCGGQDCDDNDSKVYPNEPTYYGTPAKNPAIGFDYDCSGTADPDPLLNKTVNCLVVGLPCTSDEGYLAQVPPPCGQSGPWGKCKQQGVMCVNDVIEQAKVMLCK